MVEVLDGRDSGSTQLNYGVAAPHLPQNGLLMMAQPVYCQAPVY